MCRDSSREHEALAREDPGEIAEALEDGRRERRGDPRDDSFADQVVGDDRPQVRVGCGVGGQSVDPRLEHRVQLLGERVAPRVGERLHGR